MSHKHKVLVTIPSTTKKYDLFQWDTLVSPSVLQSGHSVFLPSCSLGVYPLPRVLDGTKLKSPGLGQCTVCTTYLVLELLTEMKKHLSVQRTLCSFCLGKEEEGRREKIP